MYSAGDLVPAVHAAGAHTEFVSELRLSQALETVCGSSRELDFSLTLTQCALQDLAGVILTVCLKPFVFLKLPTVQRFSF